MSSSGTKKKARGGHKTRGFRVHLHACGLILSEAREVCDQKLSEMEKKRREKKEKGNWEVKKKPTKHQ